MHQHLTLRALFESLVFKNINIDHEIYADTQLLQNITKKTIGSGLNALTTSPQNSTCQDEEKLHWSLPIRLYGLLI